MPRLHHPSRGILPPTVNRCTSIVTPHPRLRGADKKGLLPLPPLVLDIRGTAALADDMFARLVLAFHSVAPRRAAPETTLGRIGQFHAQRAADRVALHPHHVPPLPDRETPGQNTHSAGTRRAPHSIPQTAPV